MFSEINLDPFVPSTGVSSRPNLHPAAERSVTQNFDQIEISNRPTGEEKKIMDLASRISQEIRIRPTRSALESLEEQVQQGSYQSNPDQIAAAMLLMDKEDL